MFKILVHREAETTNDLLNKSILGAFGQRPGYLFDFDKREKLYDLVIASAHNDNAYTYRDRKKHKLVTVVSSVPKQDSKEWPGFYVNLCMTDAIAASSFTFKMLENVTIPTTRRIVLDGCVGQPKPPRSWREDIVVGCLDAATSPKQWSALKGHLISNKVKVTEFVKSADIAVGFEAICPVLATCWAKFLPLIRVGNHDLSDPYLLSFQTHNLSAKLSHLASIPGAGTAQEMQTTLKEMMEETKLIYDSKDIRMMTLFDSNQDIIERIFQEVNRAF